MSEIAKLNSAKPIALNNKSTQATDEKIKEVSDMYEKYFIREMMKQMRATVHEGGFVKQNNAEKIFRDQLDDQYADQWGKAGGIGLSNIIYEQIIDRYGAQLGLKKQLDKPVGPIELNQKSNISTVRSLDVAGVQNKDLKNLVLKLESTSDKTNQELKNPWAGVLQDKKYMDMGQIQYRIKHDNGLESLLTGRGTGLGAEQKLSVGDHIDAGQAIGVVDTTSPLFWKINAIVSE